MVAPSARNRSEGEAFFQQLDVVIVPYRSRALPLRLRTRLPDQENARGNRKNVTGAWTFVPLKLIDHKHRFNLQVSLIAVG